MKTQIIDRRQNKDSRREFDKAYNDLIVLLPYYKKENHYKVIIDYLKAYDLLTDNSGARGRLFYKLHEI